MKETHHIDKVFDRINYAGKTVSGREFEACTFTNCDFSDSNFSGNEFLDCRFENCNLSMMQLAQTGLKDVRFAHCKMLGIDFSACSEFLFEVAFDTCILDFTSYFKRKLRKTSFKDCSIKEANFTQSDLTGAAFVHCDLTRTIFQQTILEKADFRSSSHYAFDPEANRIKKAKFSLTGVVGLLDKYDIIIE
ncbi:pentapeptide repeat-containing protein [Pontibacter sp. E15-1]|uniref:pentapeptide repeat-containing protein n=1 Tax=Pontibacter sp. E15-1 TaxID=2919918 RepID=UPI001F4F86CD|nr:pentapeptide repeat-containing protein [Pontibacter sp. E15-1]MCJ8165917.1 pentapeptide repeat-containing protein [Pontibacter sp. E15-1]